MAKNKVLIGNDDSEFVQRADNATRERDSAVSEVTMIRRRIRTFFSAVVQVRFPASPPAWAEDWPEWLETGSVAVKEVAEETVEETPVEETPAP